MLTLTTMACTFCAAKDPPNSHWVLAISYDSRKSSREVLKPKPETSLEDG